ncbi:Matrix metalloproteinase-19 [Stylophora pistillata]|uniref:Matrix metalloproteinase-19 n=1 Tax=Stylophora pistillata TaxID=50429 RepID=A0A2B4SJZ5_STYPI|nr:Matrix metalloproteinase-19 [Stylophora pistillata]
MLVLALLLSFLVYFVTCEDEQTIALKFLGHYGYISSARSGNHDVATAIRGFQKFYGLPASGKLDEATISLMKKPRCGMADPVEDGKRVRRYTINGEWKKKHLTYFVQHGYDLPNDQQTVIFGRAFQFWAVVSGLSFSEVNDARNADIKISRHTTSAHEKTDSRIKINAKTSKKVKSSDTYIGIQ